MNPDKLTYHAQETLAKAIELARGKKHAQVSDLHLTLELLRDFDSLAVQALKKQEVNLVQLTADVEKGLEKEAVISGEGGPRVGVDLVKVLDQAEKEAQQLGDEYISREHFILALLLTECQTKAILEKHHLEY